MLLISLVELAVLFCAGILPLPVKTVWKLLLIIVAVVASFKFHLLHMVSGGRFFAPDLPLSVIMPMAWLHAAGVIMSFILVIFSLLRVISILYLRITAGHWVGWSCPVLTWSIVVAAVLSLLMAGWGLWRGRSMPLVTELDVEIANLPDSAVGLRIAHLADIHVDYLYPWGRYADIVKLVNTLEVDVIAITGDFADGSVADLVAHFKDAPALRAKYGVFGVPGNHDYYSGYKEWRLLLEAIGITMLDNSFVTLPCGISIGGVTDLAAKRYHDFADPDVANVAMQAERPLILLSHQPKLALEAAEYEVDLQLSGHTHGGMMPGLSIMVAASNSGFVDGLYEVSERTKLYVSSGTGIWTGFPIRLGCPPEIAVITLQSAGKQEISE